MEEQDYKNLMFVYQGKTSEFLNQVIALEARELKYRQQIELLNNRIKELESKEEKPKRTSKSEVSGGNFT
jgi:hypothetical protein